MSCIRPLGLLLTLLGLSSRPAQGQQGFSLGVASGDVTATSAICWTRSDTAGLVQLQIATDRAFNHVVLTRSAEAAAENDYTVKIDIDGLSPATDYYYRFVNLDQPARRSRIGHFRTAPDPAEPAPFRFIISGDSNLALAPWLLLHFAAQEQADFFIWFGDTIYADVAYPGSPVATDLPTYRDKYYDAHAEPYLQELLASLAVWCGWDDHEVADNYDGGQPEPWISPEQIQDAYRAFFEYMPIRPQNVPDDPFRTYRRFRYGALAEFFILDGRQYRQRDLQADCDGNLDPYGLIIAPRDQDCVDRLEAPDRSMLGPEQFQWLTTALAESSATYKFLINNVPLTSLVLQPYDHWDGYDAERRALLEFIDHTGITGLYSLVTEVHANIYNPDVRSFFRRYRPAYRLGQGPAIPEFIVGPIATTTFRRSAVELFEQLLPIPADSLLGAAMLNTALQTGLGRIESLNNCSFVQTDRFAYLVVDVRPDGVTFRYRGIDPDASQPRLETLLTVGPQGPPCLAISLLILLGPAVLALRVVLPRSGHPARALRHRLPIRQPEGN